MKQSDNNFRHTLNGQVILLYLLPILVFALYSTTQMGEEKSWWIVIGGFLLAISGACVFIIRLREWEGRFNLAPVQPTEKIVERVVEKIIPQEAPQDILEPLQKEIEEMKEKWYIERQTLELLQADYKTLQQTSQEQIKKKDLLLAEYAQTVNDLRSSMETKQQDILRLEKSVTDLSYDISTLLKLSEYEASSINLSPIEEEKEPTPPPPPQIPLRPPLFDPDTQLRKCINIAQKMTGSAPFSPNSRYTHFEHQALDQRRLYDAFSSETACIVALYSRKDGNFVFTNEIVKEWLGWSPDKFMHTFPEIIVEGKEEWSQAITSLITKPEAKLHLILKSKSGQDVLLQTLLGVIPTGAFKNYAVVIFYLK